MELKSCIYECRIMHHRFSPKEHQFLYRIFMFGLCLDEIDELSRRFILLSHNRFNLFSFYDQDHLQKDNRSAKEKIIAFAHENGSNVTDDCHVQLITLPRIAGYIFNPVSFYFIFNEKNEPICAVAEVSNTYREMKPYLLTQYTNDRFRLRVPKYFYVSPFSSLELEFDFDLKVPDKKLDIKIDEFEADRKILASSLSGNAFPFTGKRLIWYAIKYPLLTLKVITLIHWHALRLKLKGLHHHPKDENPHLQKPILR